MYSVHRPHCKIIICVVDKLTPDTWNNEMTRIPCSSTISLLCVYGYHEESHCLWFRPLCCVGSLHSHVFSASSPTSTCVQCIQKRNQLGNRTVTNRHGSNEPCVNVCACCVCVDDKHASTYHHISVHFGHSCEDLGAGHSCSQCTRVDSWTCSCCTQNGSVGSVPGGAGRPVGGLQPVGLVTSARCDRSGLRDYWSARSAPYCCSQHWPPAGL